MLLLCFFYKVMKKSAGGGGIVEQGKKILRSSMGRITQTVTICTYFVQVEDSD